MDVDGMQRQFGRRGRVALLAALVVTGAGSLAAAGADPPEPPRGRYHLRSAGGRALPVTLADTAAGQVVGSVLVAASAEFHGDGRAEMRSVWKDLMYEDWPCEVLRAMRADLADGRSGGSSGVYRADVPAPDTAAADCDELRRDSSVTAFRWWLRGDSLQLAPADPDLVEGPGDTLRGVARGDSVRVRVSLGSFGPPGATEEWLFVRDGGRPST